MGDFTIGLQLLLIGFGSVIVSLLLLSLFLQASGKFLGPERKKKSKKTDDFSNQSDERISEENLNEIEEEKTSNGKKIAAISAAVYQYLDSDKNYKIISIRKADNSWKR
ncbi:MAG: OadG family transporter subunit [Bacillota bacterium]